MKVRLSLPVRPCLRRATSLNYAVRLHNYAVRLHMPCPTTDRFGLVGSDCEPDRPAHDCQVPERLIDGTATVACNQHRWQRRVGA